jgi:hypothetical protein
MWLTACPAESEQPETEINIFQKQQSLHENSLLNYREHLTVPENVSFLQKL